MKKHWATDFMRKTLNVFILGIGMITVAHGADVLVTQTGKYSSSDEKTSLAVASSTADRIDVQMAFKIRINDPAIGRNVEVTESRQVSNLPVEPGGWVFCIPEGGDVWFYDGVGAFTEFQRLPDHIETLKSCSEPKLGDRAPKLMKQWIAKQIAQHGGAANGSQPVRAETNTTSSAAGSRR